MCQDTGKILDLTMNPIVMRKMFVFLNPFIDVIRFTILVCLCVEMIGIIKKELWLGNFHFSVAFRSFVSRGIVLKYIFHIYGSSNLFIILLFLPFFNWAMPFIEPLYKKSQWEWFL